MAEPVSIVVNGAPVSLAEQEKPDDDLAKTSSVHVIRVAVGGLDSTRKAQKAEHRAVIFVSEAMKIEDERSSSGASSASDIDNSDDNNSYDSDGNCNDSGFGDDAMRFHVRELEDNPEGSPEGSPEVCVSDQGIPATILSRQGTIRGVKNLVRSSIKCIFQNQEGKRNYAKEEEGRVVVYTTSMGVIRKTYEQCRRVKTILQTLLVKFEERDVFMNRTYQKEVMQRMGLDHVAVPQVFVEGQHLGGPDVVERLNEVGDLRQMLKPYKKTSVGGTCQMCGGYQYLPCPVCGGSKKSAQHRHRFSSSIIFLRCLNCDEGGLVRCKMCINGDG